MSSKGQVVIPKAIRRSKNWRPGMEFVIEPAGNGVALRPKNPFPKTTVEDVAGCLFYEGPPVSIEEMNKAIEKGVRKEWGDRR